MKKLVIIICAIVVVMLFFYLKQSHENVAMEQEREFLSPVVVLRQTPTAEATVLSPQATAGTFKIPASPEIERRIKALSPEMRAVIEKNKLMNYLELLTPLFSEDESGQTLLLMTTLLKLLKSVEESEQNLVIKQQKALEANPDEAMLAIGVSMQRMGHFFPEEKQYLLQFAGELDVSMEEKVELLLAEAKRPLDPGEAAGLARFNPRTAFSVLGKLYQDQGKEKDLYPVVRDIVVAHKDYPGIQKMLVREYGRFDSARSKKLSNELGFDTGESQP